jgi:L-aspartate oxidase
MHKAKDGQVDFLILGSGIAGIRAAIELARHGSVLVVTKGEIFESSTEHAQGGIAVALAEDDEVHLHFDDTLKAGDGLCREEAVRILVEEGPKAIQELIEWGMRFDKNGGRLAFTREAAHSRSRVLHSHGDSTGAGILRALVAKARKLRGIEIRPYSYAVDLVADSGGVAGVVYLDEATHSLKEIRAGALLLATGGLGQVYKETTNPPVACGDGVAMGFRAGATLSDMEFIQFHPTALYIKAAPRFLLSEALRGEGGVLRNIELERFMPRYHEAAELAPRDIVSRALVMEMRRCGSEFNYLDLTGLEAEHLKKRFPKIYSTCLAYNLDITSDLIPVRPAAHYAMGGVATDLDGAATLNGLYAAGEVAATGVHGANRLASNSLLEGLVYGARAARAMVAKRSFSGTLPRPAVSAAAKRAGNPGHAAALPAETAATKAGFERAACRIRTLLWEKVGIIREGKQLCEAVRELDAIELSPPKTPDKLFYETRNILEVARAIARSAWAREESRGAHYRSDFPLKDELEPARHSYLSRTTPVSFA